MRTDEHVGLGVSYAGFGGPAPKKNKGPSSPERSPPRCSRSPNRSPAKSASRRVWKFSIWLCLFVLALSAAVSYVCDKHPLFVKLVFRQLEPYFPGASEKWSCQSGVGGGVVTYSLLWMAPFLSGGGYCSEAVAFVSALEASKRVTKLKISHHGDSDNVKFWKGLPSATKQTLLTLLLEHIDLADSVVVCHSEPGAWYPPLYQTAPCPPTGYEEPLYVIGRTMFETDSVTHHHMERCNKMDEVWVPTQFHVDTFTQAGIAPEKLVKVVQAVDTNFFNPAKVKPMRLPTNKAIFESDTEVAHAEPPFVFLSIFKWEHRKGWDVLLRSYLQEFSADDNVALYLLTNPYHSTNDFASVLRDFVSSQELEEPESGWPSVHVIDEHIPQAVLPGLYKAADCFVLPSRGEGWGRPLVEAMAMELPVISTNWSGMTEYMTHLNSYPLQLNGMSEVKEGPFKGHFWAEPSTTHLRTLMRSVVVNPREAKQKGKVARQDMVAKYAPQVVARVVLCQLLRIQAKLDSMTATTTS